MENLLILIGFLGRDPELRYTQNGKAVANLSMATSEKFKRDGEEVKQTEWHQLELWGNTAELAGKILQKGDLVFVKGKIKTDSWVDKNNERQYRTKVNVGTFLLLDRRGKTDQSSDNDAGSDGSGGHTKEKQNTEKEDDPDDDLPF